MKKTIFMLMLTVASFGQNATWTGTKTINQTNFKLAGITQSNADTKILSIDATGKWHWVDKSTLGGGQLNADWNATFGPALILNKPVIPSVVPQVQPDWNATSGLGAILNKPIIAGLPISGTFNPNLVITNAYSTQCTISDLTATYVKIGKVVIGQISFQLVRNSGVNAPDELVLTGDLPPFNTTLPYGTIGNGTSSTINQNTPNKLTLSMFCNGNQTQFMVFAGLVPSYLINRYSISFQYLTF
jgi:hypothetical protein